MTIIDIPVICRIDRVERMPARRVSNVCFGGAKRDRLHVTTFQRHAPEEELRHNPPLGRWLAGGQSP